MSELITDIKSLPHNYRVGKHMYELVKENNWCIQQEKFYSVE